MESIKKHIKSAVKQFLTEALSVDDLRKTVFNLTKYNNGFFKSEKQANFLKTELDKLEGYIGGGEMYGNYYTFFVNYDDKGITQVEKYFQKTKKTKVVFQRRSEAEDLLYKEKEDQIKDSTNKRRLMDIERLEGYNMELRGELKELEDFLIKNDSPTFQNAFKDRIEKIQIEIKSNELEIERLKSFMK